ncbi:HNH endonuclease signature motif containing protein [Hymenobacter metallicola]
MGYGAIRHQAGPTRETRSVKKAPWVSYELHIGPVPEGVPLLHTCGNRRCVRPDHLALGSPDSLPRKRGPKPRTSCPRGHAYTPESTYVYQGSRSCRTCRRIRSQQAAAARRAARQKR